MMGQIRRRGRSTRLANKRIRMLISNLVRILLATAVLIGMSEFNVAQEQASVDNGKPVAVKILEIGKATDLQFSTKISDFLNSLDRKLWDYNYGPGLEMIIISYGTDREIEKRKKLILRVLEDARLYHTRVTFVYGELCKPTSTVFWQVPRRADLPEVCEKPK